MLLRKKTILYVMPPSLKLRSFKNNRDGVSNVLGYTFSLSVAAMLMVSAVFIFNDVIDDKTTEVAEIEAQNIANYVANAIAEAVSIKQAMPEADYYKTLDLPSRIAGKKYTVEVTETEVYVKTVDGSVTKTCSTYSVEGGDSGITPTVIRSEHDKITISYDEMDYVFKFDFGKGDILSHSPVEAGYYMVSPEDGPDWYQDLPYRIPIRVTNPTDDELEDIPVKIVLNETNFDYDRVTYGSGNPSGDYSSSGSNIPQPNLAFSDSELENQINISASVEPDIWYPHWRYSSISIEENSDPEVIMEIEKDTFEVILTFDDDLDGPDSTYVWYNAVDEPLPHPIRFGTLDGKIDCISYTHNYEGNRYTGMAEFYLEDAFTTLLSLAEGTRTIEVEGYFLDKTKFFISCDITVKYGDIYVDDDYDSSTPGWGIDHFDKIQDAIYNAGGNGETIFVASGNYNEQVTINKNINLVGESWGTPIDGTGFDDYVVKVTEGVTDAVISSFVIKNGATGNDYDETDGLELDGCSNVIVTECEITGNHGRGIVIHNGAKKNIIRKCYSHNNEGARVGSEIMDGDGLVITDDADNDGTEYNYVLESSFKNCDNYDSDGIVIKNGADYNKIENCKIETIGGDDQEDWSKGIDIVNKDVNCDGPSNNVIKDCDISDVRGKYISGIGIWNIKENNGQNNPTNNKIIGGNIHDIKGIGIALYSTNDNTIKDVTINNNWGGIWTLQSNYNTIENCEIYGNIKLSNPIRNPLLPGSKSCGDGIYFDLVSDFNTVRYCDIYDNKGVAIYIADIYEEGEFPSENNIIEYCNIYGNEAEGFLKDGAIVLSCAKSTIVRYCNVYDNFCNGFLLSLLSRFNQIEHNNFYCNEGYGVKIATVTGAIDNDINNNSFAYNNGEGKDAFDGTIGDDYWENNYWDGHSEGPYEIEVPTGFPKETDPSPESELIPARNILVENTGCSLYPTIKDGVDNAEAGGIVKVYGTYTIDETIVIGTSLKLIGNDATIDYTGSVAAIKVQAAGVEVEIDSFNIQGSGSSNGADGILVTEGDSVVINNCEIHDFSNGIHVMEDDVKITNCNNIYDDNTNGIYDNTNGIYIDGSDDSANNNQITSCAFYNNNDGIELGGSTAPQNNIIIDCDFDKNTNGVHLDGAGVSTGGNTIERCKFEGNAIGGILIDGGSQSNTIKKCMIKDNECGISIEAGSTSNNIYHNHFTGNSQNANDAGSNNWDYGQRGNYWDDYLGLDEADYDGIGEEPYDVPPSGGSQDYFPIAESGRYVESLRPYSVEYWNPSGESIILVSMDLPPPDENGNFITKIIYLYYGFDDLGSLGGTGLGAIADAFVNYDENGIRVKGESYIVYSIPELASPVPEEGKHTKNEVMYVAESRFKIENRQENQANMILLSQNDPPNYDDTYLVSIHTNYTKNNPLNPNNDLYIHETSSEEPLDSVSLPKSVDNWLLLKSYICLSKNCYTTNGDSTYMNFANISSFLYDSTTYTTLGSVSYQQVEVSGTGLNLDGLVGIGCGLLGDPAIDTGKIIVDWFRVRKASLIPPIVNIGSMESRNCKWITSSGEGVDRNGENGEAVTPFKPGPVLRDFNCESSFRIEELPSGTYTITVTSGDFEYTREKMTVLIDPSTETPTGIASIIFPATTKAKEFETRSTTFDWKGGVLKIDFSGCGCSTFGTGGGIVNAITIARGQNGVRLIYGR